MNVIAYLAGLIVYLFFSAFMIFAKSDTTIYIWIGVSVLLFGYVGKKIYTWLTS